MQREPNVSDGLELILAYQHWLTNYNKWNPHEYEVLVIEETGSVELYEVSAQLFYKSKTLLRRLSESADGKKVGRA